jgi:hypothetical protein
VIVGGVGLFGLALAAATACAPRAVTPPPATPAAGPTPQVRAGELPAGTLVAARLDVGIGTDLPSPDGRWSATVAAPAPLVGARIEGHVRALEAGKGARPPKLELAVDRLCTPRACAPVEGRVASLDLQEQYDRPSRQPARSGLWGGIVAGAAVAGPLGVLLGAGVGGAGGVAVSVGERPIEARLQAGAVIVVRLDTTTPV